MMRCGERDDSAFDRATVVIGEVSFEVFGDGLMSELKGETTHRLI